MPFLQKDPLSVLSVFRQKGISLEGSLSAFCRMTKFLFLSTTIAHDSSGGPGHTDNRLGHCHPHVILLFTAFKSFIALCPLQSLFICRRPFPDGHPHQTSTLSFPPQMEYFDGRMFVNMVSLSVATCFHIDHVVIQCFALMRPVGP